MLFGYGSGYIPWWQVRLLSVHMKPEDRRKLIREVNTRYRFTPEMVALLVKYVELAAAGNPTLEDHPSYPLGYIFAFAKAYHVVLSDYEK